MKVLFLVPYPLQNAPSQRFRFEQYLYFLKGKGIDFKVQSFLDLKTWKILYKEGHKWSKFLGILRGYLRRDWQMLNLWSYNIIFIHREAAPLGPPIYEWWIAKVWKKRIIYDFDDAIWIPNTSDENSMVANIKFHGKVADICRWAWKVSAGNEYLAAYTRKFNNNVVINPTTIDLDYHTTAPQAYEGQNVPQPDNGKIASPSVRNDERVVIGWTGTHSTITYLENMLEVFSELNKRFNIQLLVISNRPPEIPVSKLSTEDSSKVGIIYQKWHLYSEIEDLQHIDIGIMPMPDNEWTRGKCGFKALQFMALDIPVIASPVGVNKDIIRDGENGFLVSSDSEWIEKLTQLIQNPELRAKMGKEGRKTVLERYSVESNKQNFLDLFH